MTKKLSEGQDSIYKLEISADKILIRNEEPLRAELNHFLNCIVSKERPITDALSALNSIHLAEKIKKGSSIMNFIKNKTFLLAGGAGFIGSHMCDWLLDREAAHVVILDNFFLGAMENLSLAKTKFPDKITVINGDAADSKVTQEIINKYNFNVVINLATKALLHSFVDPVDAYRVNTDIILNLLELSRQKKYEKLIHISSSEVFGTAEYVPMDENHPRRPETSYAAGKCAADMAVESYIKMFDINALILRPFNNFGPRQNTEQLAGIIPKTIKSIFDGEDVVIEGDGEQTRDYIYVKDTVNVIGRFIENRAYKHYEYNIGSGIEKKCSLYN